MAKTLCSVRTTAGHVFYLVQNDNNNLDLVTNSIYGDPLHGVVLVVDTNNIFSKEAFLSGKIFNTKNVAVLCHGESFKSLKDLLEKGLKIPQHQMPNLPNNLGHQMHNMAPVFNPQNQQNNNIVNQPQYVAYEHFRSNADNRNTSYGKTKYNNPNQYNKYQNRMRIREMVTSPERHITALQNGGYGNQRY